LPEPLRQAINPAAQAVAFHVAGCEIRLNLKPGASLRLVLQLDPSKFAWERGGLVEVLQGCFQACWYFVGTEPTEIHVGVPPTRIALGNITQKAKLPYDANLTRIVLPYRPALRLLELEGSDWAPPEPAQVPGQRLLIYGTSLTHGAWSVRPTETYAMQLARALGMDLINLGFGGSAYYESAMADHIAGRNDWDTLLLETSNLAGVVEPEVFRERFTYFLKTISAAHPDKRLFCTSLFMVSEQYPGLLANDDKRRALRQVMEETVAALNLPRVTFITTRQAFRDPSGLSVDLVHPSPSGMGEIARRLAKMMGASGREPRINTNQHG
jgi:lysophospholipase L1-like esterase